MRCVRRKMLGCNCCNEFSLIYFIIHLTVNQKNEHNDILTQYQRKNYDEVNLNYFNFKSCKHVYTFSNFQPLFGDSLKNDMPVTYIHYYVFSKFFSLKPGDELIIELSLKYYIYFI